MSPKKKREGGGGALFRHAWLVQSSPLFLVSPIEY